MTERRQSWPVGVAVVGCGHWGLNHLRVFAGLRDARLEVACDIDADRCEFVGQLYPRARIVSQLDEVLGDPRVDAVVIASPASTHFEIAQAALSAGKDVLCEKPLALAPSQCAVLTEMAEARRAVLMVGHVYCFDAGIHALREHLHAGQLGRLLYAASTRTNRGPVRTDVSVLYDLGCHDVAIFNYLFGAAPVSVTARGACYLNPALEDVVFLTLEYPDSVLVNVHLSWIAAHKLRQISLVGEHGGVDWDELATDVALRLTEDAGWRIRPSAGSQPRPAALHQPPRMVTLPAESPEPLVAQAMHFLECVTRRSRPLCDGRHATDVIEALWQAEQSLAQSRAQRP